MKPYKVTVEVTTKWSIEVHGKDEAEVTATAEGLGLGAIEMGGDFEEVLSIEATDIERLDAEGDEEEEGVVEVEPEPGDTVEELEVEPEDES